MNEPTRRRVASAAKTGRDSMAQIVLIVMVGVWAVSQVYTMFNMDYTPPDGLHQLIMVICGFLFGHQMGSNGNGNGHTEIEKVSVRKTVN